MAELLSRLQNSKARKWVLFLSLLVAIYWISGLLVNVYRFAMAGALFEIIWVPIILLTFMLPLISLLAWAKERFIVRSLYLVSFMLNAATILLLLFFHR